MIIEEAEDRMLLQRNSEKKKFPKFFLRGVAERKRMGKL